MIDKDNRLSEKIIWYLTIFMFASFYIFSNNTRGSLILLCITTAIFVISSLQNKMKFRFKLTFFHIFVVSFAVFCLLSSFWAWNSSYSVEKGITVVEILVCMSVLYGHYSKYNNINSLLNGIMWAGYIVMFYTIVFYGINNIYQTLSVGDRLGTSFDNINSIGMVGAMSVILMFYRLLCVEKKISLYVFPSIISIIIIAASGSRKALAFTVIGISLIILARYSSKKFYISLFRWSVIVLVLFFVFKAILALPIFVGLNDRMKGLLSLFTGMGKADHSTIMRQKFIQVGLEQFFKTPILGIGIGNARIIISGNYGIDAYVHNNFIELLTGGGIVGFSIYYGMYIYLLFSFIRYRKVNYVYQKLCVIMVFLLLIMDYGAVTYYSKSTYFYMMVFFLHNDLIKKMRINKNKY